MKRAPRWAVAALTAAIVVGGAAGISLRGESPLELAPLFPAGLLFVLAGAVASRRRPDGPSGPLLTATGLAWLGSSALLTVPNSVVATLALALFPLGLAFLAHLALAFPDGLASRAERVIVALPYALALLGVPVIETGDCPHCGHNVVGIDTEQGFGRLW